MASLFGPRFWRRAGTGAAVGTEPREPEAITPAEILGETDRIDLLEKRIDEEIRARIEAEARVADLQREVESLEGRLESASPRADAAG